DNPYVGNAEGWREEIWAYGVRNPWRSAFDASGRLWVGDVGETDWEEISRIERGGNYGWPRVEGPACFPIGTPECDRDGLTAPVFTYPHDFETGGLSVTGGSVYRGTRAPGLVGRYVLADLISHRLWSLDADDPSEVIDHGIVEGNPWIVAFGEGGTGELYAVSYSRGRILDIATWAATDAEATPEAGPLALRVAPNPSAGEAVVTWASVAGGAAEVTVLDALGRTVQTHAPLARSGRQRLDLGPLAPGVYVVRVVTPEGTTAARVTVAR
ncbi:MAG: PQQ-dependent sugar dehydrogenase, partial [Bacteroidota bacterium]